MILVDSHIHIHPKTAISEVLDAALDNFKVASLRFGGDTMFDGCLFLAEAFGMNRFSEIRIRADQGRPPDSGQTGEWQFEFTRSSNCIKACKYGQPSLFIIAGRQINTSEALEVLSLADLNSYPEGLSLRNTVDVILRNDAIPVIPWGVGKWLGIRGKILTEFFKEHSDAPIMIGDNGGRPFFWRKVRIFKEAEMCGRRILRGSDPLPIKGEEKRSGSFGFMLRETPNAEEPVGYVKSLLNLKSVKIYDFGRLETTKRFFINQLRLRLNR